MGRGWDQLGAERKEFIYSKGTIEEV